MNKSVLPFLAIAVIAWIALIADFCALHDIANDYLSLKIIDAEKIISVNTTPPEWTQCKGEWTIVQIGFMVRFIFMVIVSGGMLRLINSKMNGKHK